MTGSRPPRNPGEDQAKATAAPAAAMRARRRTRSRSSRAAESRDVRDGEDRVTVAMIRPFSFRRGKKRVWISFFCRGSPGNSSWCRAKNFSKPATSSRKSQ